MVVCIGSERATIHTAGSRGVETEVGIGGEDDGIRADISGSEAVSRILNT